jgi:hypothetical protein
MAELSELQAQLTQLLQRRGSIPADEQACGAARDALTGNDRLSPAEQLEIYREQFWLRHTGSLLEDFPGLSGVTGQRDWERLSEEYLASHPPSSYTLRDLGAQLPEYVAGCGFLEHRELCWDMARLEWAYVEAFDARDSAALEPAKLAAIPAEKWPGARLVLDPAVRLLRVSYPVATLRSQLKRAGDQRIEVPAKQPQCLVVHRRDGAVFYSEVSSSAFELLEALSEGQCLGEALATVMQRVADPAEVASNLQTWFRSWAAAGWFSSVEIDPC